MGAGLRFEKEVEMEGVRSVVYAIERDGNYHIVNT
jgi:hypothetical protein